MFTVDALTAWLLDYRYAVIFPLMVAEGPIVTILAAFLASLGYFSVYVIYLLSIVGDLAGDAGFYVLGRYGGRRLIERWGRRVHVTEERMQRMEHFFERHSGKTLITAKLTHATGMWVLMGAGAARTPFLPFLWWNFLGSVPKTLACVLLGYFFGQASGAIAGYIDYVSAVLTAVTALVLLLFWLQKRRLKKRMHI